MATKGFASSTPGISLFSSSGNSFSIENILNLSDEAVEQLKWFSKDGTPINVFDAQCSMPPLLVAPRAMFPLGYHPPLLSSSLPVGIFSLPPSRSASQTTSFNFLSHVCYSDETAQKKQRRQMKKKKVRTLFSAHQIQTMEKEFAKCRYVSEGRRAELASNLNLTEMQVKTWFQNRRTKWKKETQEKLEVQSSEMPLFYKGSREQGFLGTNTMSFYHADCFKGFAVL